MKLYALKDGLNSDHTLLRGIFDSEAKALDEALRIIEEHTEGDYHNYDLSKPVHVNELGSWDIQIVQFDANAAFYIEIRDADKDFGE